MIEIRRNEDGSLDEIVAPGFHLEQMARGHWWLEVSEGTSSVHVHLHSTRKIVANVKDER